MVGPIGRMPLARYESIDESLKKRILDVSKQEFSTHGYEQASYNKIIQNIGISKGSMYYYFENKEDLFITCFIDETRLSQNLSLRSEVAAFSQIEDKERYWSSLEELFAKRWVNSLRHPLLMSLVRQLTSLGMDHPIVCKLSAEIEGLSEYGELMKILGHGKLVEAIRDDVPLKVLIRMSEEHKVWLLQELQNGSLDESQVVEKFFEMFRTLLQRR